MPKQQMTYGQLLALRDDILRLQSQSAAFFYLFKARVDKLFALNTMAFKILESRMDEFVKKYVKHDENNQPCTEQTDRSLLYVFNSDEEKEKYTKALNNFLSLKISIEL